MPVTTLQFDVNVPLQAHSQLAKVIGMRYLYPQRVLRDPSLLLEAMI